jgi:PqqD family protein of HPr-rel-A system
MGGIIYRADPPEARLFVALDALDLIYHRPSGMTHIVAEPMPQLLAALAEGPADAAELVRRLSETHDLSGPDLSEGEIEDAIAARLEELEAIGLVWRA